MPSQLCCHLSPAQIHPFVPSARSTSKMSDCWDLKLLVVLGSTYWHPCPGVGVAPTPSTPTPPMAVRKAWCLEVAGESAVGSVGVEEEEEEEGTQATSPREVQGPRG